MITFTNNFLIKINRKTNRNFYRINRYNKVPIFKQKKNQERNKFMVKNLTKSIQRSRISLKIYTN